MNIKNLRFPSFSLFIFLTAIFPGVVFAQTSSPVSEKVSAALASVFENETRESVVSAFNAHLASVGNPADKKQLLVLFADYEERSGFFESAASRYITAAEISPEDFGLYLDAARCYMYINDRERASSLVRKTLLGSFDSDILCRARFYSVCIQLSEGDTDGAFALFRAYTGNDAFKAYYPQMLFILWYAADDSNAKDRLLSEYSDSAEASVVRGEASVAPQAFWYFMPAGEKRMASRQDGASSSGKNTAVSSGGPSVSSSGVPVVSPDSSAASADNSDPVSKGIWQQTGFFKSRANAEAMAEELSKSGFRVFIRQEKRESGTTYFSVLIPEDESGSTAMRLKDKGFESYLVID